MTTPTPKDMPQHKIVAVPETPVAAVEPVKKPFVRKPHLTDRPLKNNPGLQTLKTQLEIESSTKAFGKVGQSARSAGKSVRQFNEAFKANRQYPTSKK